LIRTITSSFLVIGKSIARPQIYFDYSPLPSDRVFQTDEWEIIELIIFSTVLFIPPILTSATNYGTEAESGLRDLFFLYGLSPGANRLRWYSECFVVCFTLSLPFAIAISAILQISFWLLFIQFLLSTSSIVSFSFALIAIRPTQALGRVVGLGILMSFFVVFFWARFSWLFTDDGYYEKRILSIFPSAAIPYTMGQIVSGHCISLSQVGFPANYPVRMGFIYMAIETVIYYFVFVLADCLRSTKWFPAPFAWRKRAPCKGVTPLVVHDLVKEYEEIVALKGVSFEVAIGETLAIVGPNGAGTSSLLGILAGCRTTTGGTISLLGLDISQDIESGHRMIGYCPQENLFMDELNAPEWAKALCVLRGVPEFDCSELFAALGLDRQMKGRIGDMSGGNKRKVCLASALIGNPAIVILDEATSGVDFTSRTRIWSLISGLNNTTVIMGTHTLEECEKIADRIMVLADGSVAVLDTPAVLWQLFKCGYLIETEKSNAEELQSILKNHGFNDPELEVTEESVKVVIPAEEHGALIGILKDFKFQYLMSIQNLEEKIFSHIQEQEMNLLDQSVSEIDTEDVEPHPRV
jgi:ABC-type multidrug transport system ATPase subunit